MIHTLEHQLDESKKRTSHQFDEIQKLEDQVRELNVELASVQSQADKQQQNVSPVILVSYCFTYSFIYLTQIANRQWLRAVFLIVLFNCFKV